MDDFGELYADVDVTPPSDDKNEKVVLNDSSSTEEEELNSDSEDDLRIVLNDDDDVHAKHENHHQIQQVEDANNNNNNNIKDDDLPLVTAGITVQPVNYSQYKYIRPQPSTFAYWDTTKTLDFSLPRHRTILDVNIDAFGHKPWNQPGVDITNFFNFGFNHETWKHYCNCLDLFRQKTAMATAYQVHGAQFRYHTASPQNVGGESAQIGQDGGVLPVTNDVNNREGRLDIPKGRAIQVDGGFGERRPSMDARRPQNRDSGVVIQISVLDNMNCSSFSSNGEHSLSHNSTQHVSDSGRSGVAVAQEGFSAETADEYNRHPERTDSSTALLGHPDCPGYKDILEVVACQTQKENEHICTDIFEDAKVTMQRNSFLADPCTLEAESTLSDRRNQSKTDESNYCETKQRGNEDQMRNLSRKRRKQGTHSRVRLPTLTETTNCVGENEALPMLTRNSCHVDSYSTRRSHGWRESQYEEDYQGGESGPCYRETEISFGYRRERFLEKPVRAAYTESFIENSPTKLRNKMDPCLRGHWDEHEYILKTTSTFGENEARQRENFIYDRRHSNLRLHPAPDKSACLTPENSFFYIEKGWQRRKRNDGEYCCRESDGDNCVLDHGYREPYMQGKRGRSVSYHDPEREYFNENYRKNVSDRSPDRRNRNGRSPCMNVLTDSSMDGAQNDEYWRHPHHESFSPYREFHTRRRKRSNTDSPVPSMYAKKSYEEDMGRCRQTGNENDQNNGLFNPTCKDTHKAVTVMKRRNIPQSKALGWPERITPRQQNHGKIYVKQSSRRGGIHMERYDLSHREMFLEENSLVHVGNRKVREDTSYSGVNTHIVSRFDIVDENEDTAAPRQMKSVDLQVVGWNGKASERFIRAGDIRRKGAIDSSNMEHRTSARNRLCSRKVIENGYLHRLNSKAGKESECGSDDVFSNTQNSIIEEGEYRKRNGLTNEKKREVMMHDYKLENESHILATLAKMEKRRERFKEPITPKEPDTNSKQQQPDSVDEPPTEPKQQRPARKRRWGGN